MSTRLPSALRSFGGAGREHMQKYGTKMEDLREDPREGEPSRGEQSAGAVPQGRLDRRRDERHGDVAGRDDASDGLPADLRRALPRIARVGAFAKKHDLRTDVQILAQSMTTDLPARSIRLR